MRQLAGTKTSNRSRLRTKPAQETTDKHRFTQIEINSQSVFIRVHLWSKLSFSKCRERLQKRGTGGLTPLRSPDSFRGAWSVFRRSVGSLSRWPFSFLVQPDSLELWHLVYIGKSSSVAFCSAKAAFLSQSESRQSLNKYRWADATPLAEVASQAAATLKTAGLRIRWVRRRAFAGWDAARGGGQREIVRRPAGLARRDLHRHD